MSISDRLAEVAEPKSWNDETPWEWACGECGEPTDADGVTTGECAAGKSDCDECFYCYCDGSC